MAAATSCGISRTRLADRPSSGPSQATKVRSAPSRLADAAAKDAVASKLEKRQKFEAAWPLIRDELLAYLESEGMPGDAIAWYRAVRPRAWPVGHNSDLAQNLEHNTPGGKLNRGLSVVDTLEILAGRTLGETEHLKASILGWCIELVCPALSSPELTRTAASCAVVSPRCPTDQQDFLVADDLMDQSITRRGQPCWYRKEGVGNIAINDAFMLESAIYFLLKKHFRKESYYVDLLELFHDVRCTIAAPTDLRRSPSRPSSASSST